MDNFERKSRKFILIKKFFRKKQHFSTRRKSKKRESVAVSKKRKVNFVFIILVNIMFFLD